MQTEEEEAAFILSQANTTATTLSWPDCDQGPGQQDETGNKTRNGYSMQLEYGGGDNVGTSPYMTITQLKPPAFPHIVLGFMH